MIMKTVKLRRAQKELEWQAQGAAAGVVALVKSDQQVRDRFWTNCSVYLFSLQAFIQLLDTRLNAIVATVKPALPTVERRTSALKHLLKWPMLNDFHSV